MRVQGKVALITGAAAGVEGQLKGLGGTAPICWRGLFDLTPVDPEMDMFQSWSQ